MDNAYCSSKLTWLGQVEAVDPRGSGQPAIRALALGYAVQPVEVAVDETVILLSLSLQHY